MPPYLKRGSWLVKNKFMNTEFKQREIKFRAWNNLYGEMVYSSGAALYDKREFYPFCFEVGFSSYPESDWQIMQYTGLKDKNGKEIYEGDIGRWPSGNNSIIEWDSDRGCFTANHTDGRGGRFGIVTSYVEIIGNIFENPELLK